MALVHGHASVSYVLVISNSLTSGGLLKCLTVSVSTETSTPFR